MSKTNYKIRVSARKSVYERDRYTCVRCGFRGEYVAECQNFHSGNHLTLDHIVRRRDGGTNAQANLQTLCFACNNERG